MTRPSREVPLTRPVLVAGVVRAIVFVRAAFAVGVTRIYVTGSNPGRVDLSTSPAFTAALWVAGVLTAWHVADCLYRRAWVQVTAGGIVVRSLLFRTFVPDESVTAVRQHVTRDPFGAAVVRLRVDYRAPEPVSLEGEYPLPAGTRDPLGPLVRRVVGTLAVRVADSDITGDGWSFSAGTLRVGALGVPVGDLTAAVRVGATVGYFVGDAAEPTFVVGDGSLNAHVLERLVIEAGAARPDFNRPLAPPGRSLGVWKPGFGPHFFTVWYSGAMMVFFGYGFLPSFGVSAALCAALAALYVVALVVAVADAITTTLTIREHGIVYRRRLLAGRIDFADVRSVQLLPPSRLVVMSAASRLDFRTPDRGAPAALAEIVRLLGVALGRTWRERLRSGDIALSPDAAFTPVGLRLGPPGAEVVEYGLLTLSGGPIAFALTADDTGTDGTPRKRVVACVGEHDRDAPTLRALAGMLIAEANAPGPKAITMDIRSA